MIRCDMECDTPTVAVANVTWGNYPNGDRNRCNACQSCVDKLWGMINPSVTAMVCHFAVGLPVQSVREGEK